MAAKDQQGATTAQATIDVELDSSPGNKRRCPSPTPPSAGTPLTLEVFQSTIQPLLTQINNIDNRMGNIDTRVGQVENAFAERMKEQVSLLTAITQTQTQHSTDLASLQQQDKHTRATITSIQDRLTKLEITPPTLQARANSSTTAEERQPALIMGGWADDQDATVTLQLAKDAVTSLQLDIDMEDAFVPGVRRGYLVMPYTARRAETESNMHNRLATAIQKVRQANQATGAINQDGTVKRLWMAYSQTPERRRRARYAGKVKRLMLEQGGNKDNLQVEFATGTLWYQGRRIASATAPPPQGNNATKCALGWVDAEAISGFTRKSKETILTAWNALIDPLLQQ